MVENNKKLKYKNINKKYSKKLIDFLNNKSYINNFEINYKNFKLLFVNNLKLNKYKLINIFIIYIKNKIKIYNDCKILKYFLI
jgi:hypothetical protein